MDKSINNKRIAKNTLMLYVRMIVIMLVSIYTTRVVLNVLGVEDFGIYSVVAGTVAFMGFLNNAMSMATQRFLNVELGKKDNDISKVFNMSLNIHFFIALFIVLLAEVVGLWLINNTLNIPAERLTAANWVFQCVVGITFIGIIQVPYNSAVLAYEKMEVFAYFSIFDVCLKLGLTFMLRWFDYDKLILYGFLMLAVQVCIFFLYSFYVSTKFKECRLKLLWDKVLFKKLGGFFGWNICGQVAQVLTNQGVNMVANVFHGVIINSAIEITNQVNGTISMFVSNFQTSFRPQIMKSYAAEVYDDMKSLVYRASKVSFYLLYIVSIPIMLNIDEILRIWLGNAPDYSATFCKLLIWYSFIESLGMPLVMVIMATGENKYYQIFVSLAISLNIVLTWLFLFMGFSPEWIFYIKIIISFLVIVVRLFFAKKQSGINVKEYYDCAIVPVIKVLALTQPIYIFLNVFSNNYSLAIMIIITASFLLWIMFCIYRVGFTIGERLFIKNFVTDKIKIKK